MKVDKDKIKNKFLQEGKDENYFKRLLENYPDEIDDALESAYNTYLESGSVVDFDYGGVTLNDLLNGKSGHFFKALMDMDKLMSWDVNSEEFERLKKVYTDPPIIE